MLRCIVFSLLITLPATIIAQENYVFHHLTTADGLSSNVIQSIFQDSKGFYWIGTTSGLQIFDGYTFSKPLKNGNDMLPSPTVTESRDGMIWISTGNSLYRYNRINKRFISLKPDSANVELNLTVIEDTTGTIWLINSYKLYKYDAVNGKLTEWLQLPTFAPGQAKGAITYQKGSDIIWIQNGTTFYGIAPAKRKIIKQIPGVPMAAAIWADRDDNLWISYWNQNLCRYNSQSDKKEWYTLSIKRNKVQPIQFGVAFSFARDVAGKLWIGSIDGGLWYFDELTNRIIQFETDNQRAESFHYNETVYSITMDNEQNIWVGSDRGINIFNPFRQRFYTINNSDLPTNGIHTEVSQMPFETSTGDILIATNGGGWLLYDHHLKLKQSFAITLSNNSSHIDRSIAVSTCFAEDKEGKIYIGHRGGVLETYDPKNGVQTFTSVPEFRGFKITDIKIDSAGNIWFAFRSFNNNLVKWDAFAKRFISYNDSRLKDGVDQTSSILITKQQEIWVQTFGNGMYRFDPAKEKIVEIHRDGKDPFKIPAEVHGVSELNDSVISISSFSDGFFLLNTINKTCATLNTDSGLPSNIARAMITDASGNYWIAMLSDLVRMDPKTKQTVSFNQDDGVINKSFIYGFTRLRDGRMFISTSTGLLYFHPDSITIEPAPSDVVITGLKISSKPVLLDSILLANNNSISLEYDQNFITIDFVSVSYLHHKTNSYFYKLNGLENDWVEAEPQRSVNYTNLTPGRYEFMVRCRNRDGIFSNHISGFTMVIAPPLWRTWWAYTFYVIFTAAIVYALYRNRIESFKRSQHLQLSAMVSVQEEERKRISRDLHDDVGTKLSALKLFLSSLKEKAVKLHDKDIEFLASNSEQFVTEAMQDVRELLLNLSPAILEEFGYTTAVENLVNKINETKKITFTLIVFGSIHRMKKDIELALYRITQELINNILKHADAKDVSLQIGERDNKIILMIEDNGKGFDVNVHKDGYGIQNLHARTKLMHGTISIESNIGKGTSVLIEIPYDKASN